VSDQLYENFVSVRESRAAALGSDKINQSDRHRVPCELVVQTQTTLDFHWVQTNQGFLIVSERQRDSWIDLELRETTDRNRWPWPQVYGRDVIGYKTVTTRAQRGRERRLAET
jgi:hypothetical protein